MDQVEGKVENLVERARHMSLKNTTSVGCFHATIDDHLTQIYESIKTSEPARGDFFQSIRQNPDCDEQSLGDPLASLDAFRGYMKDPASCAQAPPNELDLSAPISDYFISSSHNTYLTGNQLYSDAAASAYSSALLRGCRSVEIDVWDGEPEDTDSSRSETSSDSSDEAEESLGTKLKKKITSRSSNQDKPAKEKSEKGLPRSISSKLGDALHRTASKPSEPIPGEESATSQLPRKAEPRVLHGHTLTKGTTFREICYAIRDSAFVTSDLPIIISFEVHTCLEQQQMMVDIVNEAWKGLLVEVPPDVEADKLPSLEQLKGKILIKTKSTPLPHANKTVEVSDDLESKSTEEPGDAAEQKSQKPAKPPKILEALARLAVYTRAYHFNHFDQPEAHVPVHVFSLSEKAAREAHTTHRDALFEHNRSSMMRIYPFAFRVTSSNLDPSFYWRRGAQLVALNWQNLDKGMMLNHGMFVGTPGWELKPSGYRSGEPAGLIRRRSLDLTIEVFAAQNLSLPHSDRSERWFHPYVVCQLHVEEPEEPTAAGNDASSESEKSSYRRCTKSSAGCNPDFEGQKLGFPTVAGIVEELSFVRFKIKDDEIGPDSLAAWACIRLDRLREGYRLVHLHDETGENAGGVLLVRITKQLA